MMRRPQKRYSTAFKKKVVTEIETGQYSLAEVRRRYDIGGATTVYRWLARYGTTPSTGKVIYVHTDNENDPLTQARQECERLREKTQQLESALAQAYLDGICLKATLDVVAEDLGLPDGEALRKKFGTGPSSAPWMSPPPESTD